MADAATDCSCNSVDARYTQFRLWRDLPADDTNGRFAEVSIRQCVSCDTLWLEYFVEYEGFTASGRWGRGIIDKAKAQTIKSADAPQFLAELPSYLVGGSYFGDRAGVRKGMLHWDL